MIYVAIRIHRRSPEEIVNSLRRRRLLSPDKEDILDYAKECKNRITIGVLTFPIALGISIAMSIDSCMKLSSPSYSIGGALTIMSFSFSTLIAFSSAWILLEVLRRSLSRFVKAESEIRERDT